jgi:hypothetical protein
MKSIEYRLDEIYAKITPAPDCACDDLGKCCSQIPMLPAEAKRLGLDVYNTPVNEVGRCLLLKDGRCSVYINRPFICRVFNSANKGCMTCPEMTDHGSMSNEQYEVLFAEWIGLLDLCNEKERASFEKSWAESESVIVLNEKNNGW